MSILSDFRDTLENISPLNVYVEYDGTPLDSRTRSFVTVGIESEECSYGLQDSTAEYAKDRVTFRVRVIMPKTVSPTTLDGYFNTYILNALMKSDRYNVLSVSKDTPGYTKCLDRVELPTRVLVECIETFN
jgi:hypothetical protein